MYHLHKGSLMALPLHSLTYKPRLLNLPAVLKLLQRFWWVCLPAKVVHVGRPQIHNFIRQSGFLPDTSVYVGDVDNDFNAIPSSNPNWLVQW